MRATKGARSTVVAVVAALLIVFAGLAYAADPGTDFRVSNSGFDQDTDPGAFNPAVAYNSTDNEYLAVWYGDGDATFEYEIYGQRIDAATGNEIGPDFRISTMGADGDLDRLAQDPAVAYDPASNRYLVVWYGNHPIVPTTPLNHFEVWGKLIGADGTPITTDTRLSTTGTDTSQTRAVLRPPSVTFNTTAQEYFVVWTGNPIATQNFNHYDIYGQRVSNAGVEVGTDVPVSQVGTNAPFDRSAFYPDVAYNSQANEYVVIWYANDLPNAFEYEIWGQRISAAGAEVGTDDFRISNVGADNDGLRDTGNSPPSIAYNSTNNEYLVAWYGDGLTTNDDYEIFGQRLDAAGNQVPSTADFRISNMGPEGSDKYGAFDAAVTYNSGANEYLVAWYGLSGSEVEICGQRVAGTGGEVGGDFRISNTGADGDTNREAFFPDVAYGSNPQEYVAVWYGDGLATDDEFEVFARRLGASPQVCTTSNGTGGPGPTPTPAPTPPTPQPKDPLFTFSVNAARVQSLRSKAITVRTRCDEACTVNASGSLNVPGASKTYRLRSAKRSATANRRVTLRLKLSAKTVRAAKRALARRKQVRATIRLRARDAGNGLRRSTVRVRLKR